MTESWGATSVRVKLLLHRFTLLRLLEVGMVMAEVPTTCIDVLPTVMKMLQMPRSSILPRYFIRKHSRKTMTFVFANRSELWNATFFLQISASLQREAQREAQERIARTHRWMKHRLTQKILSRGATIISIRLLKMKFRS